MKLYAKVTLGVVVAFTLMFVMLFVLRKNFVDPTFKANLSETLASGSSLPRVRSPDPRIASPRCTRCSPCSRCP